jgi:hypothetical protein
MKKMVLNFILVLLLPLAFALGYLSGFSGAQKKTGAVVATDSSDSQRTSGGKEEYEPYFTRQNAITVKIK